MPQTGRALEVHYDQSASGEAWRGGRKLASDEEDEGRDRRRLNRALPVVSEPWRQPQPASRVHDRSQTGFRMPAWRERSTRYRMSIKDSVPSNRGTGILSRC
jgi:hypothetical protein